MKRRSTILMIALCIVFSAVALISACSSAPPAAPVATPGITLNKSELSLTVGQKEKLVPSVKNADGAKVSFSSDKRSVATVDDDGEVTAVAAGNAVICATITVDSVNYSADCTVTVNAPPVPPSITLDKSSLSLTVGDTYKLKATVDNADAAAAFSSTATDVATVSADGTVTAKGAGSAKIIAKITVDGSEYSAECNVTVNKAVITLSFEKSKLSLCVADSGNIALVNPSSVAVVYTSSDEDIATVSSDGTVTGVGMGKATITATCKDDDTVKASFTVTVLHALRDGLDFIKGMDMSSVISLEQSGVKFKDAQGTVTDVFEVIAAHGVTTVRVRVWNDPYNTDGNGYGGGNCDIDKAVEIGKRVTACGMDLLVDFHYSDFWADPAKYAAPKAWSDYTVEQKVTAVGEFTTQSLNKLKAAGVAVGMVQVGNETTGGLCGEKNWTDICKLMNAGSAAVRAVYPDALVALHFTNPEKGRFPTYAATLDNNNVDYDVFGTSYYPCYHGTLSNLKSTLTTVADTYDKYVMVLETQYPYTPDDTDGTGNTLKSDKLDAENEKYDYSIEGQYNMVKDVFDTVAAIEKGLGVCYWEGAWISVDGSAEWTQSKHEKWTTYGSGWASSYASEYDSEVTVSSGTYVNGGAGSVVDNQAFFDANGKPLDSLKVFLLEYGSKKPSPSQDNVLVNPGFETDADGTRTPSGWDIATESAITQLCVKSKDSHTGNNAYAAWYASAYEFKLTQTVENLIAGKYTFTINMIGTNPDSVAANVYAYVCVNGVQKATEDITISTTWQTATIEGIAVPSGASVTVGICVDVGANVWVSIDDASLNWTSES